MSDDDNVSEKVRARVREHLVTQREFYDHLNKLVFKPHLGHELQFSTIKDVVHGIGDVVNAITLDGNSVRFGKLGTFKPHVTPPGPRWDPTKKENFKGLERRKLAFKQSKSTKRLFHIAPDED